jgi:hypothetical protein
MFRMVVPMSLFTRSLTAAATAVCIAGSAGAAPVEYDFQATVVQDATGFFLGQTGMGTFSYDDAIIPTVGADAGDMNYVAVAALLPGVPDFDFTLNIFGQTFTDPDSPFSFLGVRDFEPIQWSFETGAGNIDNPQIVKITTVPANDNGFNLFMNDDEVLEVGLIVEAEPAAIPLPASVWMLGLGMLGLGAWARRRSTA